MEPTPRRAARVLLVDDADRLLLLRGADPARPAHRYWMTVGGGLDAGESLVDCALREVAEETGLRLRPEQLGAPVRHEVIDFPFDGEWYRQEQDFFLVRVPAFEVSTAGHDVLERETIDAFRWWPLAELAATAERVYPPDLAELVRGSLRLAGRPC
ncbi:MAG TPA: NUDIX domain-containing protein [Pilimelia sp.]|nr:NUDIX domain-containing protein [Pilimelia sp.]